MAICSLHILDGKFKPLISRNYRGEVDPYLEEFSSVVQENDEGKPLVKIGEDGKEYSVCFTSHNSLYLVASITSNANVSLVFTFLHKFVKVLEQYLIVVNEESVRDNFVFLYELLDEILDFGYPQTTEASILQHYITQEKYGSEMTPRVPPAVTNAVSWRADGIKYAKNEVFLDVVEAVNLIMHSNGTVVSSQVEGSIQMRCYLSGMPELRLGLNDRMTLTTTEAQGNHKLVNLDNVKFHQCVRLARFESNGTIAFIPPDGAFELLSYRIDSSIKPLILVQCDVQKYERSRVIYRVRARSQFKRRSLANNVEIVIPSPADADSPIVKVAVGVARYVPERSAIVWTIKSFPGGQEVSMSAELRLPSVAPEDSDAKRPVTVAFQIPYFTISGLQIRYLKINEKSGYSAMPLVRYTTKSGDYIIRINEAKT